MKSHSTLDPEKLYLGPKASLRYRDTTMIKHSCPNLPHLVIYQGYDYQSWTKTARNDLEMTDVNRNADIIGKIVRALPSLEVLKLANHNFTTPFEPKDEVEVEVEDETKDEEEDYSKQERTLP
jgi:hypothetical protein